MSSCSLPSSSQSTMPSDDPVCVTYKQVQEGNDPDSMLRLLQAAFGPGSLGLIIVTGVPCFPELRQLLLSLIYKFVTLPSAVKQRLEDPVSSYTTGWSFGREMLKDNIPDTAKESFYFGLNELDCPASPASASPESKSQPSPAAHGSPQQVRAEADLSRLADLFPAYYRSNVWPSEELPALREVALQMGFLMRDAGLLLARQVDRYTTSVGTSISGRGLERQLRRSRAHKARILGYHPPQEAGGTAAPAADADGAAAAPWCTEHTDHGALTGLVSAMYFGPDGTPVPCPDPQAGLWVRRGADQQAVHVRIPPGALAFQMGETAQVASGDRLRATPHYVAAPQAHDGGAGDGGVTRVTMALFLQPDAEEPMETPEGMGTAMPGWEAGITFGAWSKKRFDAYYKTSTEGAVPHFSG